jgi:SSS family solute:Na+ symporter
MNWLDWLCFLLPAAVVVAAALHTRRYMKSVADFLAGGRVAGRYLVANAEGTAAMGVITIVATFEMIYGGGFSVTWWGAMQTPVWVVIAISGYIIYRYRETRAMTMAQFFEMRYSRRFRVFMGLLAFLAGIINYGIFPAVSARFFVYYFGWPEEVSVLGHGVPTFALVMTALTGLSLFLVLIGGQLTAMVTNTIEGIIGGVLYLVIAVAVLLVVDWGQITSVMTPATGGSGQSLLNPFDSGNVKDFNVWYMLISVGLSVYWYMAWQGSSGFNASAASPHEAKMGRILGHWRAYARSVMITLLAVAALAFMKHPDFAGGAAAAQAQLAEISNATIRTQMTVPVAVAHLLPHLARGFFAAVMLYAVMACDSASIHSWGSIFIQDVVLPLRQSMGKPALDGAAHIRWLRWSIVGIAVFAWLFSLLYRQTDFLFMFMTVTGSIFLAGAGSCIVGGLYWKRGSKAGAWSAMLVGMTLSVGAMVLRQVWPQCPLNAQILSLVATVSAIVTYFGVSMLGPREECNLDQILHRGKYAVDPVTGDPLPAVEPPPRSWHSLIGVDRDFTRGDRWIAISLFVWSIFWFLVFLVVTVWCLMFPLPVSWWSTYFYSTGILLPLVVGVVTTIWFTWGGIRDLRRMMARLKLARTRPADDGAVSETKAASVPDPK